MPTKEMTPSPRIAGEKGLSPLKFLIPDLFKALPKAPPLDQLIQRGFQPRDGVIDILLIFPPSSVAERYGKEDVGNSGGDVLPLGIAYIASYLREKGLGVGVLDCCALGLGYSEVLEIIDVWKPKSVGISSTTFVLHRSVELARRIKIRFPDKLLLLGGAHANAVPMDAMENHDSVDMVVWGEGEITTHVLLQEFARHNYNAGRLLADHDTLEKIEGIVFRSNSKLIKTSERPVIMDLDTLPLPARDLLPVEKYIPLPNQYRRIPIAHMVVIRGCPYVCTFCDQAGTTVRTSSPQRVVEEIRSLAETYGIREISFWDDTLTYNKKWMKEFCRQLIDARLDIVWSCYATAHSMDWEVLQQMGRAGCWNIFYGVETNDTEVMKNILVNRKNKNSDYVKQVFEWTHEAGIETRASFMLAMPGETPEKAESMIQYAIALDPDYAQFSITTPYPGTRLYDEIKQGKWGKLTTEDFSNFQMWNVVFLPNGYESIEQVMKMERQAFRSFFFRPAYILKCLFKIRTLEDIKRYWKGMVFLVGGFSFGPMPGNIRELEGRN